MAKTDASGTLFASPFSKLNDELPFAKVTDELLDMGRETARRWLDMYEQALESIASSHEQAAGYTDVEWLATAARTQAKLVREIAARQVTIGRELLD
jgi:hypothetical protein